MFTRALSARALFKASSRDDSADSCGTSSDENSSENWLALAEAVFSGLESASAHRDGGAVDDSRAAGKSGNDGGERRHVEC